MKKFEMKQLPYHPGDLHPYIGRKTVELHWAKHYGGYVDKLNSLLEKSPEFQNQSLEWICKYSAKETEIYNNSNQIYNHEFYFDSFRSVLSITRNVPSGRFHKEICNRWDDFDGFKKAFKQSAMKMFGSGYVWLSYFDMGSSSQLFIRNCKNADNFLKEDSFIPLLCADVWEHSYYLDYHNQKDNYIDAFFSIVNWDIVEERFETRLK
jgi:Fe-Mn family superoxide dismutase